MADNYLEKRMEELRSGRLTVRNRRPGIRPGAQRVLIAGGCHGQALEKTLQYRREGHRVAVFDADAEAGKQLAYKNGVRFHHVDTSDPAVLKKGITALLQVWRGIDVIAGNEEDCRYIDSIIKKWKDSLPIPDKSVLEIVIL